MSNAYRSVFCPGLFDDRLIIVTGGGSGIGRCIAHELANLGAHVALTGRRLERLETVRAEIDGLGGVATTHAFTSATSRPSSPPSTRSPRSAPSPAWSTTPADSTRPRPRSCRSRAGRR